VNHNDESKSLMTSLKGLLGLYSPSRDPSTRFFISISSQSMGTTQGGTASRHTIVEHCMYDNKSHVRLGSSAWEFGLGVQLGSSAWEFSV